MHIGRMLPTLVGIGLLALPVASHADTLPTLNLVQTSDHCTNNCNSGASALPYSGNSITVVQTTAGTASTPGVLDITATLASGWNFLHTGNPSTVNFGFALLNIPSATFVTSTPATFSPTGWEPIGTALDNSTTNTSHLITGNTTGLGMLAGITVGNSAAPGQAGQAGYGLVWLAGNGSAKQDGSTLHFTISALELTLASLVPTGSDGAYFYADVGSNRIVDGNRVTGLIDFGPSPVPLPGALPLFATGLGLLGLLGSRRKRKAQAAA